MYRRTWAIWNSLYSRKGSQPLRPGFVWIIHLHLHIYSMHYFIQVSGMVGKPGFIPGKAGVDYPDFKIIPETDFTCQNFLLPGFYADTFTSCQVKHFFIFCYIYKHLIKSFHLIFGMMIYKRTRVYILSAASL